jgi:lipid-A-disaccharide synthase
MGTPCVVGYKLSFLSWVLSKILIKVKYISMTNIIADRMIIPELIQYKMTPQHIGNQINKLLNESEYYDAVQESLLEVKNIFLNKQNVMKNAAKIIHTMCNEKN